MNLAEKIKLRNEIRGLDLEQIERIMEKFSDNGGENMTSWEQIENIADDIREQKPSLSKEQAIAEALQTREGKKLYREYKANNQKRSVRKRE